MFTVVGLLGLRSFFELSFFAAMHGLPLPHAWHESALRHIGRPPRWYTQDGTRRMSPAEIAEAQKKLQAEAEETAVSKHRGAYTLPLPNPNATPPVSPTIPIGAKPPRLYPTTKTPPTKAPPTKGPKQPAGPPPVKGPKQPLVPPPAKLCPMTPPPPKMLRPRGHQPETPGASSSDMHGSAHSIPPINLTSPAPERPPPKLHPKHTKRPPPKASQGNQTGINDAQREIWEKRRKELDKIIQGGSDFQESMAKARAIQQQARAKYLATELQCSVELQELYKMQGHKATPCKPLKPPGWIPNVANVFPPVAPDPNATATPLPYVPPFPPVPPHGLPIPPVPPFLHLPLLFKDSVLPPPPPHPAQLTRPFIRPPQPPPAIRPRPSFSRAVAWAHDNEVAQLKRQLAEKEIQLFWALPQSPVPPPPSDQPPSDQPPSDADQPPSDGTTEQPASKKQRLAGPAKPNNIPTGSSATTQPAPSHPPKQRARVVPPDEARVVPPDHMLEPLVINRLIDTIVNAIGKDEWNKYMRSQPDWLDFSRSDPIFTPPGTPPGQNADAHAGQNADASHNLRGTEHATSGVPPPSEPERPEPEPIPSPATTPTEPEVHVHRHLTQWQRPTARVAIISAPNRLYLTKGGQIVEFGEQPREKRSRRDQAEARVLDFFIFCMCEWHL